MTYRLEFFNSVRASQQSKRSTSIKPISWLLSFLVIGAIFDVKDVQAQSIVPAAGLNGTGTIVSPTASNSNQLDISGGRLSSDRTNLFHSLQRFGLNPNEIANFVSNPNIQNILTRVTGGDPSYIYGLIKVTGGNSNLYLMNPAGILFGSTATVNVPASFTATTANGIGFGSSPQDLRWFSATGVNDYGSLNGTPTTFAFTMSQPAPIVNLATTIVGTSDTTGTSSLTLVGGTILSAGDVTALTGRQQIRLAAVPGQKLIQLVQNQGVWQWRVLEASSAVSQPQAWTLPTLDLPQLLTGGNVGQATRLKVNVDGTIELRVDPDGTVEFVIPGSVTPLQSDPEQVEVYNGFAVPVAPGDAKLFINNDDIERGLDESNRRVTRLLMYPQGIENFSIDNVDGPYRSDSQGGVVFNVTSELPLPKSTAVDTIKNSSVVEVTGDILLKEAAPAASQALSKTDPRIADYSLQSDAPFQDFPSAITSDSGNPLQQNPDSPINNLTQDSPSAITSDSGNPSQQNSDSLMNDLSCISSQDETQPDTCSRLNQNINKLYLSTVKSRDRILQIIDGGVFYPQ